ncbi:hypothetical protein TYRP_016502 [Tyrophagus putrescentiae]|nr:hypothetical protein TYRP_016502 [Tyrophagus putrescentiae]
MSEDCAGAPTKKKKAKTTDEADEGKDVQEQQKQEQSPLLQVNDDVLLLLFSYLLPLVDALHLGSTCRRLYGFYQKSCTDRRSLEIYRENLYCYSEIRLRYTFDDTAADELTKGNHCSVALPKAYTTTADSMTTFFRQLFARLPNLLSLEVVDEQQSERTFPHLLTALRSSPLLSGRLQALTLVISEEMRVDHQLLDSPLHLPALKHLTLYIGNDSYERVKQFALNSPLLDTVLPQLTTFRLYAESSSPVEVLQFIDQHFLWLADARLATLAAADTSCPSLQIALNFSDDAINNQQWEPREHRQALACVDSLDIFHTQEGEVYEDDLLLPMLPLLANLVSVKIDMIYGNPKVDAKWYLWVLTALAKLPKLKEVVIEANDRFVPHSSRKLMPVLPTVRFLSMGFTSTYHANPVEAFHLAHCFPNLQQIIVIFEQSNCEFCDYRLAAEGDLSVFQECALRMSWDLQRLGTAGTGWQAQVKLKKLEACFPEHKVLFSSLENLLAGIKDADYQG